MAKNRKGKFAVPTPKGFAVPEKKIRPELIFGKQKRKLSTEQEFEIMKLVLDKFLWMGFGIMAFGLYHIYSTSDITGLYVIIGGAVVLLIFIWILVREYEIAKF